MKVFISWSGDMSLNAGYLLKEWLPNVIQMIDPFVSASDTKKGTSWFKDISNELSESSFGLLCMTKENKNSKWMHFEAGAIANKFGMNRMSALLIDMPPSELEPPLGQFQNTLPNKNDMYSLVSTLNGHCVEGALKEEQLSKSFNKWWPEFDNELQRIKNEHNSIVSEPPRSSEDILLEILELSRVTARRTSSLMLKNNLHPQSKEIYALWPLFVREVQDERIHVSALLQHSTPLSFEDGILTVAVPDEFHKRMLESQQEFLKDQYNGFYTGQVEAFEFDVVNA